MFHKSAPFPVGPYALGALIAIVALAAQVPTHAQTVTLTASGNDLYNTGYDGTSLAGNNQPDTHYVITNYLTGQTYQANPLAPMWVANSGPSQWITIANNTTEGPSIIYNYQLALTNIPVGSVVHISGLVAADDNATISANGASSAATTLPSKLSAA
jgi:hypothetical protein